MNYQQTLEYLYGNLPMYQRVGAHAFKKDLHNIRKLCLALDNPQNKFRSVHIAGTNGKGSSAHMLASILQTAGFKTGLYTSPHLKSFTERIRINGKSIEKEKVVEFVENNKEVFESIQPSFFEMTVAMAFDHFANEEVDIAIIEVGLGGRLDSTNIIKPEVSLITSISYDHQHMLGDTLEEIAVEKAGIMKRGVPVVIANMQKELISVFVNQARQVECPIYFSGIDYRFEVIENTGQLLYIRNISDNTTFALDLPGEYQVMNLPGVFKTCEILRDIGFPINRKQAMDGLARVRKLTGLKGRWQLISKNPRIICDTGHNTGAIQEIVKQLKSIPYANLHIVIGTVNDKDIEPMLALLPSKAKYYFCQPDVPRSLNAHELAKVAANYKLKGKVILDVNSAVNEARINSSSDDLIFVGGSTFVVAELNEFVMRKKMQRFAENAQRRNVVEPGKPIYSEIKGKWSEYFGNDHPIVVEMGCGRGEYTVGLGKAFPGNNFIGVDIKGDRIWKGAKEADLMQLKNVAFLRTQIQQIENFFVADEVDEIWITFPDPRPKDRDEKRRLTFSRFIELYKLIMKPGGLVHLKTDNTGLFEYSLETNSQRKDIDDLEFTRDLYTSDLNAASSGNQNPV